MSVGTPHTARIGLLFTGATDTQPSENTFYLQDSTDAIFADPSTTALAIWVAAVTQLFPHVNALTVYNGVSFEDVRTVPFGGLDVAESPVVGGHAYGGGVLPSSTCKAIKKNTGTLGRSGRGRWFFPAYEEGQLVSQDEFTGAVIAEMVAALDAFQVAVELALAPAEMGIVSYTFAGTPRIAGQFEHITSWGSVNNYVDTQRRRLLGHNRHR